MLPSRDDFLLQHVQSLIRGDLLFREPLQLPLIFQILLRQCLRSVKLCVTKTCPTKFRRRLFLVYKTPPLRRRLYNGLFCVFDKQFVRRRPLLAPEREEGEFIVCNSRRQHRRRAIKVRIAACVTCMYVPCGATPMAAHAVTWSRYR